MNERERLIEIMKSQKLNSKQLSLELGVSAGTISNIMGGRNKPSLEFLQNVANHFPFISPTWLFLGFGGMYIDGYVPDEDGLDVRTDSIAVSAQVCTSGMADVFSKRRCLANEEVVSSKDVGARAVQKVLIFYTDGTFEER
jgi:transcriptional regulator with XRE-family HTH domain